MSLVSASTDNTKNTLKPLACPIFLHLNNKYLFPYLYCISINGPYKKTVINN